MVEVLVWLLMGVGQKNDNPQVVERFMSKEQCEHVLQASPQGYYTRLRCVQARIAVPKG